MKNLFILLSLFFISQITSQEIRLNDKEFFTVSLSIDPMASIKEKGLDIVGEIEYVGFMYGKLGFESFEQLEGGYTDIHAGVGFNLASKFDNFRTYGGVRVSKVSRNGTFRVNPGLELGLDYKLNDNTFVGLRSTLDKRFDQEIFRWNPEIKFSGFVRIGYRWNWYK